MEGLLKIFILKTYKDFVRLYIKKRFERTFSVWRLLFSEGRKNIFYP